MTEKIQGIVIRSNDRKEKDKNILLFSLENGKFWATLKGVKSPTAKMKMAQNIFCFGEFVVEDGKFGKIVTGFESIETFHEISENVEKYFEGTAILEVVNAVEFENEAERKNMFVLTLRALKTLCFSNVKECYVLNKFLIEMFALSGFGLYTDKCSCCGAKTFDNLYLDYANGSLVCAKCKNFNCEEISKTTYSALKILNNTNFENLQTVKLADLSELGLLKILVKDFENRFDKKLKLLGILS